jgi:hypothetical protein
MLVDWQTAQIEQEPRSDACSASVKFAHRRRLKITWTIAGISGGGDDELKRWLASNVAKASKLTSGANSAPKSPGTIRAPTQRVLSVSLLCLFPPTNLCSNSRHVFYGLCNYKNAKPFVTRLRGHHFFIFSTQYIDQCPKGFSESRRRIPESQRPHAVLMPSRDGMQRCTYLDGRRRRRVVGKVAREKRATDMSTPITR